MADTISFQNALAEALEARREWLDRTELPRLKDEFRLFHASFTGLRAVLIKKGILHEDPYKNDSKIGDVKVPDEGPFTDNEKIDQMSIRLSNYEQQLDFLVNFFQFSVDFLTMERLKRVLGLTKYIAWTQLGSGSSNLNTRTLAELIAQVKGGNDQLSIGLISDTSQHLDRATKNAMRILKDVSDFHRESYKLELRMRVMSSLTFARETVITHKDDTVRQVKRKFAESMGERPFYPELLDEILKEDYSGEGENLKADLLKRLEVPTDKPKEEKRAQSFKAPLMDGIRTLALLGTTVSDGIVKITGNSEVLESGKNSFMDKLRRLVRQMLNRPPEEIVYEIEYVDPINVTTKRERLNFTSFRLEVDKKARFLASLLNKTTTAYKRLEAATEEQLLSVLGKNIEELQSMHKTMAALDTYFKAEAGPEMKDRIRGIKPELAAIKNGIIKANQKRHEYLSQKEELEQMKKLGINTETN